ncbi:aldo/keto reductase [Psychroserpens damuponensis]|uniref:aldo/keto reductase n=1 Tax=Psychroserpens damuponensis TaxID=943936 RepID=UPI00058F8B51|nr:aldo/keto reductase [Psychroserpens damuponensis]
MRYSRLIAGTMTWGIWGKNLNTNQIITLMQHCIEQQVTSFDHADIYGNYSTEANFGNALAQSGISRNTIQLISKCGIQLINEDRNTTVKHYNYDTNYIIKSAEDSLKHLKTDYLDLFLLHRPSPLMQPDEIAEAISNLKKRGLIRHFGVSNFSSSQVDLIASSVPVTVNQIELSLSQQTAMHNGALDYMMTHNITPMAWSPLGNIFREDTEQTRRVHNQLGDLLDKYNATKDQLLLAWILKHPSQIHPVIGTTTKQRIADAAKAVDINLELQDWFKILEANQGYEVA